MMESEQQLEENLVRYAKKRSSLVKLCKKFVDDNKITCEECISQTDRVIENAYEFIANICDIVGYYEDSQ
jgi:hypothetical protein